MSTIQNHIASEETLAELTNTMKRQNTLIEQLVAQNVKSHKIFGYRITHTDSNPTSSVTYLGDCKEFVPAGMDYTAGNFSWGSWENAWFMPKPCMLGYDGIVKQYLDPNDYTKKLDGTPSDVANASFAGNAMMEWGQLWYKYVYGTNYSEFYLADYKADDDYVCWSNHGESGVKPHFYTPCFMGYYDGTRQRSISGVASTVNENATTEMTRAKANGVGWNIECVADRLLINSLLVLISKSLDTQTKFGNGVMSVSAAIANGTMNDKGLFWGANDGTHGVKVFGMENYWGNLWRSTAGWIVDNGTQKIKMCYGQEDGSTVDDYNTTGSGYVAIDGATPSGTSGGYINAVKSTSFGMIPTTTSGSSSTYWCDGMWFNNSVVAFALCGGSWGAGPQCGAFFVNLRTAAGIALANVGAAPSYK